MRVLRKCYASLTPREREVMVWVVSGLLNLYGLLLFFRSGDFESARRFTGGGLVICAGRARRQGGRDERKGDKTCSSPHKPSFRAHHVHAYLSS